MAVIILNLKIFLYGCHWWILHTFLLNRNGNVLISSEIGVTMKSPGHKSAKAVCETIAKTAQAPASPSSAETWCFWVSPRSSASSHGWTLPSRQELGSWGCWSCLSKMLLSIIFLCKIRQNLSCQRGSMDLIESKWQVPRLFLLPALGSSRCPGPLPSPCHSPSAAGRGTDLFLWTSWRFWCNFSGSRILNCEIPSRVFWNLLVCSVTVSLLW